MYVARRFMIDSARPSISILVEMCPRLVRLGRIRPDIEIDDPFLRLVPQLHRIEGRRRARDDRVQPLPSTFLSHCSNTSSQGSRSARCRRHMRGRTYRCGFPNEGALGEADVCPRHLLNTLSLKNSRKSELHLCERLVRESYMESHHPLYFSDSGFRLSCTIEINIRSWLSLRARKYSRTGAGSHRNVGDLGCEGEDARAREGNR